MRNVTTRPSKDEASAQCWVSVADGGPTLLQHRINVVFSVLSKVVIICAIVSILTLRTLK